MPVKKKRNPATGPLIMGAIAVVLILGLLWYFFLRPKPKVVAPPDANPTTQASASPAARPASNPPPPPTSAVPGGLAERIARLEAFLPPEAEPTEDLITRLDRLEAAIGQLQAQLAARVPGTLINEWRVPAQKPDDPPAISNDFLVTRSVWRVACRVARTVGAAPQVLVRVYLRQEPDRVVAEIPANSSMEIRSQPGVYFFRATAVDADIVVAWESQ